MNKENKINSDKLLVDSSQLLEDSGENSLTTNHSQLTTNKEVQWKTLGEVVKLEKGKQLNKELLSETGLYPAYNGGTSYSGFTDIYNYNENTIIITQI